MQKPEVVNSSRKYRVRVLVCAPSNSALDEIVLRVLNTGTSLSSSFSHLHVLLSSHNSAIFVVIYDGCGFYISFTAL